MQNVDLQILLETGAHFGHQTRRWNPKMQEYIYGDESGVHIFDLALTKKAIDEALEEIKNASSRGQKIIFVGTKKQAKEKVIEVAKATDSYYVSERWLGGTLTNFDQILATLKQMDDMKEEKSMGSYNKYTKKERLMFDRKIERIERFFGGLYGIKTLPSYIFVVDAKRERGSILEAQDTGVKSIAIVDSNSDPRGIDYVIPMNDDATKAISYVLDLAKEAILEGNKVKLQKDKKDLKSESKEK